MNNRPAITLPPAVQSKMLQYEVLMNHPDLNSRYITDVDNFRFKHLLEQHSVNGETHSFATWLSLAEREDVLNYIYLQIKHDPFDNFFVLHWAVMCRQPRNIIKIFIELNPKLYKIVYATDQVHDTPLHLAVREGNLEMAADLIDITKNPDLAHVTDCSPLHLAVAKNDLEMTRLFIVKQAQLDLKDGRGCTPLHIAIRNNSTQLIKDLVAAGAGTLFQNSSGDTAAHLVLQKSKLEAEKLFPLLGWQCDLGVNTTNNNGETIFTLAAANGHLNLVNRWLDFHLGSNENSVKLDQVNINKAFKAAVRNGHADIVYALLPHIDNFKDECAEKSNSALMIAAQKKYVDIIKMLCNHLLVNYMAERDAGQEYKKYTYFFVKKGQGFSRTQKIAAAQALVDVLEGRAALQNLNPQHYAALNNGELRGIKNKVLKFCSDVGHLPMPAETALLAVPAKHGV